MKLSTLNEGSEDETRRMSRLAKPKERQKVADAVENAYDLSDTEKAKQRQSDEQLFKKQIRAFLKDLDG